MHYNPELELILDCDASSSGLGAVLSHKMKNGEHKPIAYASRTLAPAERKYSQLEKEGLSIVFGLKCFHRFLYGREFCIVTDHKPLLGLFGESRPVPNMASACIQRWALLLGAYNHSLIYKPGKAHNNAGSLSRMPGPFEHATVPAEVVFSLEHFESGPVNSQNITLETRKIQF